MHGVDEESILGDDEVWSCQASITVRNGHNFLSDRWISVKHLLEFPDDLLHGVDDELYSVMMRSGRARLD